MLANMAVSRESSSILLPVRLPGDAIGAQARAKEKTMKLAFELSVLLMVTLLGATINAQTKPAADWNATVEAAKREGVVKCACPPRREFALAFKKGFEDAYPGITLEITAAALPAFPLRVAKEQSAKMFLWDVYTFGPGAEIFDLKNKGGLESLWDYLSLPEVLSDSAWIGGIKDRFLDVEQRHIFGMFYTISTGSINRDALPDLKIKSFEDLLSPALKGKLVAVDPRVGGAGESLAAAVFQRYGRDGLKKLFVDQDVMLMKGNVEVAEQVVRKARPISLTSVSPDSQQRFKEAGVKLNIGDLFIPELARAGTNGSCPAIFKNPPNPNATKVFINWLLSRSGQKLISETRGEPSARSDVPEVSPEDAPKPGIKYLYAHKEEVMTKFLAPAQKILRELIP
jgi:ABC-type Fe3+ transport system substrate-binding protein